MLPSCIQPEMAMVAVGFSRLYPQAALGLGPHLYGYGRAEEQGAGGRELATYCGSAEASGAMRSSPRLGPQPYRRPVTDKIPPTSESPRPRLGGRRATHKGGPSTHPFPSLIRLSRGCKDLLRRPPFLCFTLAPFCGSPTRASQRLSGDWGRAGQVAGEPGPASRAVALTLGLGPPAQSHARWPSPHFPKWRLGLPAATRLRHSRGGEEGED